MGRGVEKMTKSQAGRLGGTSTFQKYGREHMQKIGKLGGEKTRSLYTLKPYGQYQWAMVKRDTGVIIAIIEN
jgi:general stress protein YciG